MNLGVQLGQNLSTITIISISTIITTISTITIISTLVSGQGSRTQSRFTWYGYTVIETVALF